MDKNIITPVSWLMNELKLIALERDFTCWTYAQYRDYAKQQSPDTPYWVWRWFDLDGMLLRDYAETPNIYIVYKRAENQYILLNDIEEHFPVWEDNIEGFFRNHPNKETNFYILRYEQDEEE